MKGRSEHVAGPPGGEPRLRLTRRGALALGGAGAVAVGGAALAVRGLGGPSSAVRAITGGQDASLPGGSAGCVAAETLTAVNQLRGAPLVYDVSGERTSFRFEPAFLTGVEGWLARHATDSGLGRPAEVWTLGSWIAGDPGGSGQGEDGTVDSATGCRSWHNAGRALDLTRLVDAAGTIVVSFREEVWSQLPAAEMEAQRQRYWRAVAGLHRDFDSVLTYLFNDLHRGHVHVDDGRVGRPAGSSPSPGSVFRTRTSAQVRAVQAMCTWVWGRPVERTGDWDDATREATGAVLAQVGVGGALTDGTRGWHSFLDATLARRA